MGAGIAEVCTRAGLRVTLFDVNDSALRGALDRVDHSLNRAVSAGILSTDAAASSLKSIDLVNDLDAFGDADLVVEAASERQEVKLDIFRCLDNIVTSPRALLASNTSSIPIMKIAMATSRPDYVIGMHFFNPVPVLRLVEIVPSLLTSQDTQSRARAFAVEILGKVTILSQDRAGFVVNSLLVPYLLAAIRMYESGFASAEDIDAAMVLGCAHPMGPLRLADLIGLDTLQAIAEAMYEEHKEPLYAPAPALLRMVEASLLGKKSGRGFYAYDAT